MIHQKKVQKFQLKNLINYGIRVIVLTGDNAEVTKCICDKVGIKSPQIVIGSQIDKLQDIAVKKIIEKDKYFCKTFSYSKKARIVRLFKKYWKYCWVYG